MNNKIKTCRNKCIFCFVDQLPENLRNSLYIKDDDYIQSFNKGNFITLTNLSSKDINNIIKYKLSPLYVSFHSADNKIRECIFGTKRHIKSIDTLKILDSNNIQTNIQIVLCPGINDGQDLANTLDFLSMNFKNIFSIGVVPVGITKFNKNLNLISFDEKSSKKLIKDMHKYNNSRKNKFKVFLSDEFYIMAGFDFPEYEFYESFPQIENGIGLCRNFIHETNIYLKKNSQKIKREINKMLNKKNNLKENSGINSIQKIINLNLLILTSRYFLKVMQNLTSTVNDFIKTNKINLKLNFKVKEIENNFFGGNVKVAGLLTYHDFINAFNDNINFNEKELKIYDKILIPDIIFNEEGLTLDDKNKKDFKKILKNIRFVSGQAKSFLREIFNL
ncbi:MAG: DUF512 domain-containing protein [Actinobacteria bacterium]|nr:DUF512 domain-containing protein [Actinomycetota bacterium]